MFTLPTSLIFKQSTSTMVTSLQYFCLTKINIDLIYTDVKHRKSSHFRRRQWPFLALLLNNELKELIIYLKMFFLIIFLSILSTHTCTLYECACVCWWRWGGGGRRRTLCNSSMYDGTVALWLMGKLFMYMSHINNNTEWTVWTLITVYSCREHIAQYIY